MGSDLHKKEKKNHPAVELMWEAGGQKLEQMVVVVLERSVCGLSKERKELSSRGDLTMLPGLLLGWRRDVGSMMDTRRPRCQDSAIKPL